MEEENNKENIDVDSLSWGSASKDCVRKVYGNLEKMPSVMAMKIEIANVEAGFALGNYTRDQMHEQVDEIKKHYKEGETK